MVELLVVIGIIAILAGVALGPITGGIEKAKESGGMQQARQVGLIEFSYSNDNNQTYPYNTTGALLVKSLLDNGYASDPGSFFVSGVSGTVKGTGTAGVYAIAKTNVSFDFMMGSATTGLTSSANDGTPLVMSKGITTLTMAASGPVDCTINPANNPFGSYGLAVCYKNNSAFFKRAIKAGANATITGFVDSSFSDSNGASYVLVAP